MAIEFNGTSSNLSASSVPGATGFNNVSVVMWMKSLDQTHRQFPFIMGNFTNFQRMGMDAFDGDGQIKAYDGANAPAAIMLTVGAWTHVALIYSTNTTTLAVYVNGALSSSLGSPTMALANTFFSIGSFTTFLFANVQIAEIAKYDLDFSNSTVANPEALRPFVAGMSPKLLFPQNRVFYSRHLNSSYYADYSRGLALTATALGNADHPRIYG